jgi:hypothetical protein
MTWREKLALQIAALRAQFRKDVLRRRREVAREFNESELRWLAFFREQAK